jgi:hypothetical protein
MMLTCDGCGAEKDKMWCDREQWFAVECDGLVRKVFCYECDARRDDYRKRIFAATDCVLVSCRPVSKYQEMQ